MKKIEIPLSPLWGMVKKIKIVLMLVIVFISSLNYKDTNNYQEFIANKVDYKEALLKLDSYKKVEKKVIKETVKVNTKGNDISSYAIQFNGNPYVWGGTSLTKGTDCSGFTQSIYKHFGKSLPRTVEAQVKKGFKVSFDKLQKGDLIFYSNGGSKPTHVALYIGNGKIIHAANSRDGIKISSVHIMKKVAARRITL